MPDWLQILFIIIFTLLFLAGVAYGGYVFYKYVNKAGMCSFTALGNVNATADPVNNLIQSGYISCHGGGPAWRPEKITITNLGPGTFYIMVPNQTTQKIDPSNSTSINITDTNISPTVLHDSKSQYSTPNFDITVI